jgi:hypothetical protein
VWRGYGCTYPGVTAKAVRKALDRWDIYMVCFKHSWTRCGWAL